jgi:hypothetical protein
MVGSPPPSRSAHRLRLGRALEHLVAPRKISLRKISLTVVLRTGLPEGAEVAADEAKTGSPKRIVHNGTYY